KQASMAKDDKQDDTSNNTSVRELGNVSLQCPKLTEANYTTWALMMETIMKAYGIWETIVAKKGVETNEKKENTSKAIIFQTLPQDVLMQVAQYSTAKEVWDSIKVKHLGADLVQKARLQTLRSELETLRIKPNEKVSDFGGKLSSIMAKFKGLGETLEDKVLVRKLLNSVPKKFLPIVATIEQYQDLDEMSFEEAVGRLTAYEERIKSQDTLEANDQDKLLMASSNNKSYGKWRGKDFNKEAKESMKWKNNPNARRASTSQGTKDKSKLRCYECAITSATEDGFTTVHNRKKKGNPTLNKINEGVKMNKQKVKVVWQKVTQPSQKEDNNIVKLNNAFEALQEQDDLSRKGFVGETSGVNDGTLPAEPDPYLSDSDSEVDELFMESDPGANKLKGASTPSPKVPNV
ncbi:hypothetical protein Tco_1416623, partial [Tanacetum coccineum]